MTEKAILERLERLEKKFEVLAAEVKKQSLKIEDTNDRLGDLRGDFSNLVYYLK